MTPNLAVARAVRGAIALILSLFLVGAAVADEAAVRCVQQYLTEAGFDAGGVDGAFGKRTALAGEAYLASAQAMEPPLPPLSQATAALWCDALAPAAGAPPQVAFAGDIRDKIKQTITEGASDAQTFFAQQLPDVTPRQGVTIYAGNDAAWLTDRYLAAAGLPKSFRRGKMESFGACDPAAEFAWYAIFLCTDHAEWKKGPLVIKGIVAHEYWHTMQADLVGKAARSCCTSDSQAQEVYGPEWLKEGSAQYGRHAMLASLGLAKLERDIDMLVRDTRGATNLLERNNRKGYRDAGGDVSENMGVVATYLLVRDHGYPSLADFYRNLGAGLDDDEAFEQAFGMSMADFEAAYVAFIGSR